MKPDNQKNQPIYNQALNKISEQHKNQVPIRKGCPNGQCFCTGACQEIVSWRDKTADEIMQDRINHPPQL